MNKIFKFAKLFFSTFYKILPGLLLIIFIINLFLTVGLIQTLRSRNDYNILYKSNILKSELKDVNCNKEVSYLITFGDDSDGITTHNYKCKAADEVNEKLDPINSDISSIKSDISLLKSNISSIKSDIRLLEIEDRIQSILNR